MTTNQTPRPDLVVMFDIETWDTGPRSVTSQIAFTVAEAADPETIISKIAVFLPLQPQIVLNRTVSAETIVWWMSQSEEARKLFAENTGDEFEELPAFLRHINRKFSQITEGKTYEVWARGPQFDITNIESLMQDCAIAPAWRYSKVRDLRTLMELVGLSVDDVPRPSHLTPHIAIHDCVYQMMCYTEAMKRYGSR